MPFIEDEKIAWLKIVNPDRINQRIIGSLGGRSLQKAKPFFNQLECCYC